MSLWKTSKSQDMTLSEKEIVVLSRAFRRNGVESNSRRIIGHNYTGCIDDSSETSFAKTGMQSIFKSMTSNFLTVGPHLATECACGVVYNSTHECALKGTKPSKLVNGADYPHLQPRTDTNE